MLAALAFILRLVDAPNKFTGCVWAPVRVISKSFDQKYCPKLFPRPHQPCSLLNIDVLWTRSGWKFQLVAFVEKALLMHRSVALQKKRIAVFFSWTKIESVWTSSYSFTAERRKVLHKISPNADKELLLSPMHAILFWLLSSEISQGCVRKESC